MALHTVFGAGAPYTQSAHSDGLPNIRVASIFYLLGGQTWQCVGGRVHIPDVAALLDTGIRVMAWTGVHETPIELTNSPLRLVDTTTPPAAGWVDVAWEPFDVVGGTTAVAIGYIFANQASSYLFTDVGVVGTDPVQSLDGSPFYLAESGYTGGRSRFRVDVGTTGSSTGWYGTDIVLDDGATPNQGSATGAWTFVGSAEGERDPFSLGNSDFTFTASATGEHAASGTATGGWVFTGTAVAGDVSSGSAAGGWEFGSAAAGERDPFSWGNSDFVWAADAAGSRTSLGVADGGWSFGSAATAGDVNSGTAAGAWSFTGAAVGARTTKGLTPTVLILQTLRDILDLLTTSDTGCQISPQPCRTVLSPGIEIAWDECGAGCTDSGLDGQLWANITTMAATSDTGNCERIIWTADIGIVRCAATVQNDGSPPPVSAVEHDAWQQAADSDYIRYAIRCCPSRPETIGDVELVTWTSLGPSGGCVGGAWTIRGILDSCECVPVPQFPRERGC